MRPISYDLNANKCTISVLEAYNDSIWKMKTERESIDELLDLHFFMKDYALDLITVSCGEQMHL
jgi:hypothetical protein